ncbi:MAG TPA: ATP-binding protein, partial [Candidatus Dormibacteraeota bacterium]|nr:ATP-binding protein [Candidatus Dormibacteraeota bacterium]
GYSEILINDYAADLDESGKRYLSRISEASTRMDGLIADLLSYGRLTHAPVDLRKVSTEHAIQKALSQLELQIRSRKAVIKTGPLDSVQADPGILNLVLLNLLENAIKFTATDVVPCVQIGTERRGAVVRLCVKDNGIGIAPQYHERIFGAFERLNQSETEGTGIGLAVVKHAVERMGGRVGIESHPGQGSMFWIELPSA